MRPFVALLVPVLVGAHPLALSQEVKVSAGELLPDVAFREVLGGDGRTKLSEFRGQPVLIAWYSTVFAGMEGARVAADLERELNGDLPDSRLVVILMAIKKHESAHLRAMQLRELPGARCRLLANQELYVAYDQSNGPPPRMVLIDPDGKLLYAGSYQGAGDVEELVGQELERIEKGWGTDPLACQARALAFGKGRLGEARELVESALAGAGPDGPGGREELTQLAAQLETRYTALERSVGQLLDQGEPRRAAQALASLTTATEGHPAWYDRTERVRARFELESPREAELEKKLDSLMKPTLKNRPKKGLEDKLRSFAEGDAAGTKVGQRAARLADAVALAMNEL